MAASRVEKMAPNLRMHGVAAAGPVRNGSRPVCTQPIRTGGQLRKLAARSLRAALAAITAAPHSGRSSSARSRHAPHPWPRDRFGNLPDKTAISAGSHIDTCSPWHLHRGTVQVPTAVNKSVKTRQFRTSSRLEMGTPTATRTRGLPLRHHVRQLAISLPNIPRRRSRLAHRRSIAGLRDQSSGLR